MLREELDGRCRSDVENGRLEILISEVETAYSKFRTHIMLVEQQRFSHQQMRAELDSTTVMVTLDFGTFQSKNGKLPDLVLVIHFLSDSELCHIYLDCLPRVLAAESKVGATSRVCSSSSIRLHADALVERSKSFLCYEAVSGAQRDGDSHSSVCAKSWPQPLRRPFGCYIALSLAQSRSNQRNSLIRMSDGRQNGSRASFKGCRTPMSWKHHWLLR